MMSIKIVLFDLDGTLLPMKQEDFVSDYFGKLCRKVAYLGYDADELVKTIWAGTAAMIKNDGSATNEAVFWQSFAERYGSGRLKDKAVFDEFYDVEFNETSEVCGFNRDAAGVVALVKSKGLRTVLATNPLFPMQAVRHRIRWAGLQPTDFELITSYETSRSCKPNTRYYTEITGALGVEPCECLMVGNDTDEDMAAEKLGMRVFLLTDCLINKSGADISKYENGGFDRLFEFIGSL